MVDKDLLKKLREEDKKTYQEIANVFKVSRQRIHQIYKDYKTLDSYKNIDGLKYSCFICGKKKNLEIHHIDGDTHNNDLNNLVCLCLKHHHEADKKMKIKYNKKRDVVLTKKIYEKNCPICNKNFNAHFPRQKLCSKECFGIYISKIQSKNEYANLRKSNYKEYNRLYYKDYYNRHKNDKKYKLQLKKWQKKNYEKLKRKGYFKAYFKKRYQLKKQG